ncbi:MAG: AbrB/MazE/SpoVT family DNA-binding domain-containing protein [Thermoplasmatota archaeon]
MATTTAISKASTQGNSLRTTIPMGIVNQFDLTEGDKLEWNMTVKHGKLIIEVEPVKTK